MKGACDTSNFRGISLTSLVGKIMCMVLNNRLAGVLEAKKIMADEQGGFVWAEVARTKFYLKY